jgi:hypothetical protein
MPKTCASFAEEKTGIFTADTATQITTNLLAKYALWRVQLVLPLHGSMRCIPLGCLLNSGDHIVSSSSVLVQHIRCLLIIFKMEHTNLVF